MASDAFGWDAAECLAVENQLSTLEQGIIADVVVVDGNPLDDLRVLQAKEKSVLIMKEGQACKNLLS
jgi:imidazolonepropionase-like amidohydrolase